MTDPDIPFIVARLLEQSPATAEQLWLKGCQAGFEKSLKTYRRAIDMLYDCGIPLSRDGYLYVLAQGKPYCEALATLFRHLVESKSSWRSVVYGDIERKYLANILCSKPAPAEFLWRLLAAAVESRLTYFHYAPQHPGTREYLRTCQPAGNICTPRGILPVTMIVHYLVFSCQHFVLLGETQVEGTTEIRQYEVAGIDRLKLGPVSARTLKLNPSELYRHSVYVWLGGDIHEVQLENLADPAGRICEAKVNGEDEILAYVMASLGNLRIASAPRAIFDRARELALPLDQIFRSEGNPQT